MRYYEGPEQTTSTFTVRSFGAMNHVLTGGQASWEIDIRTFFFHWLANGQLQESLFNSWLFKDQRKSLRPRTCLLVTYYANLWAGDGKRRLCQCLAACEHQQTTSDSPNFSPPPRPHYNNTTVFGTWPYVFNFCKPFLVPG